MISNDSYTLFEFNKLIKQTIQREFSQEFWVVAEVADLKVNNQSGHCYIDLVEKSGEKVLAKSRAVIWASTFYELAPWFEQQTGERLRAGMKVMAGVRVSYHEVYGLSFTINRLNASFTMGERARKRKEIVEKLKQEGYFQQNKERALTGVPLRIAIISSVTAAGFEDFIRQLETNEYGYQFYPTLFDSVLQGPEAIPSIRASLSQIAARSTDFDVAVIIRGGGAQLDLDTFDSYDLAIAIAKMPLPVLTGIGHERDETIADLVSFQKLKTPTATAQFLIQRVINFEENLVVAVDAIRNNAAKRMQLEVDKINRYGSLIRLSSIRLLDKASSTINSMAKTLEFSCTNKLLTEFHRLELQRSQLNQHDPEILFEKGYSFSTISGVSLNKLQTISDGDTMITIGKQLKITSTITNTARENGEIKAGI